MFVALNFLMKNKFKINYTNNGVNEIALTDGSNNAH